MDQYPFGGGGGLFGGGSAFPGNPIYAPQALNFAGVPGLGSPFGQTMAGPLQLAVQRLVGPGWLPAQFAPQMNLYDFYRRQAEFQQMQQSIQMAAQVDQRTYLQMFRGAAGMAGLEWTSNRQRAAQSLAGDFATISPQLALMMPELFDRLHGSLGSAQVMARYLYSGGRYGVDPVTGLGGLTPESTAAIANRFQREFDPSRPRMATGLQGLTMGRMGQLYDEMSRRGLMSPEADMALIARHRVATGRSEDLNREVARLTGGLRTGDLQVAEDVRQFHANRTTTRLKEMAGVVSAMQDIFGDLGRPDAPMHELLNGLQQLTQTDLGALDPQRTEQMVRTLSNLARRTGMGIENLQSAIGQAGVLARQLNLEPVFGARAAGNASAFAHAYGLNEGGLGGWRRAGKEEILQRDLILNVGAANSVAANQMAAVVRMGEQGLLRQGTSAAALYEALQRRDDTFVDPATGQRRSVHVSSRDWLAMMQASGVRPGTAQLFRQQSVANREYIDRFDLADRAREAQGDIAGRLIGSAFGNAAASLGITDRTLRVQIGKLASQGLLHDLSTAERGSPAALGDYIRAGLIRQGVKLTLQREQQINLAAAAGGGQLDQIIAGDPNLARIYGSGRNLLALHNRANRDRARLVADEARVEADLQQSMAGLGRGSPLRRVVDLLLEGDPALGVGGALAQTLGFERSERVEAALRPTLEGLQREAGKLRGAGVEAGIDVAELRALRTAALNERDPVRRAALRKDLQNRMKELGIRDISELDNQELTRRRAAQLREQYLRQVRKRISGLDRDEAAQGLLGTNATTGRERIERMLTGDNLLRWRRRYGQFSEAERTAFEGLGEGEQRLQIAAALGLEPGSLSASAELAGEYLARYQAGDPAALGVLQRIWRDSGATGADRERLHRMSRDEALERYGLPAEHVRPSADAARDLTDAERPAYQNILQARRNRQAVERRLGDLRQRIAGLEKAGKRIPPEEKRRLQMLEGVLRDASAQEQDALRSGREAPAVRAVLDEEERFSHLAAAEAVAGLPSGSLTRPVASARETARAEMERQKKDAARQAPAKQEISGHLTVDMMGGVAFLEGVSQTPPA